MRDNGRYRSGLFIGMGMVIERLFYGGEYGHVTVVVSLMEREWSCYGGGQFNGGSMVMLQVVTLMKGELSFYINRVMDVERSCYGGVQF